MNKLKLRRDVQLKCWIDTLEDILKEFPSGNTSIGTIIKNYKLQLKELEKK